MIPYVKEIIYLSAKYDNNMSKVDVTPSVEHNMKIDTNAAPLNQQKIAVFHNFVSK